MSRFSRLPLLVLTLCTATVRGQSNTQEPHIGYLYPAGGQGGTVVRVTVGGQNLRGATDVYISGDGVHGKVLQYCRPLTNLNKEERALIQSRIKEVRDKLLAESGVEAPAAIGPKRSFLKKGVDRPKAAATKNAPKAEPVAKAGVVKMPDHPLFYDLDNKGLRELTHITTVVLGPRKRQQPNRQIAESVLIEITIDPNAEPNNRELRIGTPAGLTNPMVFQVGLLPEIRELEPNNRQASADLPNLPKEKPFDLPVQLNGQILPGDVDRFRFQASRGQRLVIETQARSLIPYLADAVPGWFQATLALFDAKGAEVAFVDDYRFNPDPVLFYNIPEDGEYELEIRDSIYRGREDFVYRIAVGEQPFVTQVFPLGARVGVKTVASISGWNLAGAQLPLETRPGDSGIRQTVYSQGKQLSKAIPYSVDTLPECNEAEYNDNPEDAQRIDLPMIINGRIDRPGDVDTFRLEGRAGDKVVAEVYARRLNSPLDSLLRLTDASGKVLLWNDDNVTADNHLYKDMQGLVTHHADSYLMAELPKDGTYYVQLNDAEHHGGDAYGYRLRIAAPQPDFALRVTPSSLSMNAGALVPVCVHVLRKDGFDGEIEVALKDVTGFELTGGRIPAGRDRVRMTLTAPMTAPERPVALHLEGLARIDGQRVNHPAVPAEDMMQAFLYRHLVPSQELLVEVRKSKWRVPPVTLAELGPIRIPVGGMALVVAKTRRGPMLQEIKLELDDPPEGLTLHDVTVVPEGLAFQLRADKDKLKSGFTENVIVKVFREFKPQQKDGKPANQAQRTLLGVFPAIPIEIVRP